MQKSTTTFTANFLWLLDDWMLYFPDVHAFHLLIYAYPKKNAHHGRMSGVPAGKLLELGSQKLRAEWMVPVTCGLHSPSLKTRVFRHWDSHEPTGILQYKSTKEIKKVASLIVAMPNFPQYVFRGSLEIGIHTKKVGILQ